MWTTLICFGLLRPIGIELIQIFNIDGGIGWPPNLNDNFRLTSAQVLFDLFLVKNHTYISREDFTNSYFSISVAYIILRTWGKVLLNMAHVLAILCAVTFYLEVKRLYKESLCDRQNLKVKKNNIY
jgi:hypothetical protein